MAKPSLTIAIPFHQGLEYLKAAVESVLAQEDPEWTLLVCDDGGSEREELRAFLEALQDERIHYHEHPESGGMVGNWNRQFELAQSELLTLLHQDDQLLPNYVGLVRSLGAEHPTISAFFTAARIIGPDGGPRFSFADWIKRFLQPRAQGNLRLAGSSALEALLRGNFIMCPTLCFRIAALEGLRFDPRWQQVQDLDLLCRLLLQGHELLGSPQEAYAYRRHAAAATSLQSESLLRFEEENALLSELAKRCAARNWQHAARIARSKRIVKLNLIYCSLADCLRLRWAAARRKLGFLRRMG